jgi:hypothetical protein
MRALSLDKPSTMGRFLLTSIEDAHKRVWIACHAMKMRYLEAVHLIGYEDKASAAKPTDAHGDQCVRRGGAALRAGFPHNRRVTRITLYTPQTVQCAVDDRSRRSGLRARLPHPRARVAPRAMRFHFSVTSLGYE